MCSITDTENSQNWRQKHKIKSRQHKENKANIKHTSTDFDAETLTKLCFQGTLKPDEHALAHRYNLLLIFQHHVSVLNFIAYLYLFVFAVRFVMLRMCCPTEDVSLICMCFVSLQCTDLPGTSQNYSDTEYINRSHISLMIGHH